MRVFVTGASGHIGSAGYPNSSQQGITSWRSPAPTRLLTRPALRVSRCAAGAWTTSSSTSQDDSVRSNFDRDGATFPRSVSGGKSRSRQTGPTI